MLIERAERPHWLQRISFQQMHVTHDKPALSSYFIDGRSWVQNPSYPSNIKKFYGFIHQVAVTMNRFLTAVAGSGQVKYHLARRYNKEQA